MIDGNKVTGTSRMNLVTFPIDLERNNSLLGCQLINVYNCPSPIPVIKMRDVHFLCGIAE
jgi:hypothetical protein